jgi:putative nucleotidyltransferase with HDIG domain
VRRDGDDGPVTTETRLPVSREDHSLLLPTRLDHRWLARRAARLDPRRHPAVSASAQVSHLLGKAPQAGNGSGAPASRAGHTWRVIAGLRERAGLGERAEVDAVMAPPPVSREERRGRPIEPRSMAAHHLVTPERSARTGEILAGLSAALDMVEGHQPGHALRTCFLAMRLADSLQLPHRSRSDVFYVALLKDAGSATNASALAALLGTSDIEQKRQLFLADADRPLAGFRFAAAQQAPQADTLGWLRRVAGVALGSRRGRRSFAALRADGGAGVARELAFSDSVCEAIHDLRERWDGHGEPSRLTGAEIPKAARVVAVAEAAAALEARDGERVAEKVLRARRGQWYDPELVDLFLGMARLGLWQELRTPDLLGRTLMLESEHRVRMSNATDVDWIAFIFAQIVDGKSPMTTRHSVRVGNLASLMALQLGLEDPLLTDVRRAALLHDLGKLGVPNTILDRHGPLDAGERAILGLHVAAGAEVLAGVELLRVPARLVAHHHDPLDGSGFAGLEEQLAVPARIVAVADFFDSLTAERPYPHPVARAKAVEILRATTGDAYLAEVVKALESAL